MKTSLKTSNALSSSKGASVGNTTSGQHSKQGAKQEGDVIVYKDNKKITKANYARVAAIDTFDKYD